MIAKDTICGFRKYTWNEKDQGGACWTGRRRFERSPALVNSAIGRIGTNSKSPLQL